MDEREAVLENKQLMTSAGEYNFQIELYSLNYQGLEYSQDFKFNVLKSSEKRKVIKSKEKI